MSLAWLKLVNIKYHSQTKINTGRLISKLSLFLINKVKSSAFESLKLLVLNRNNRSKTEVEVPKNDENL